MRHRIVAAAVATLALVAVPLLAEDPPRSKELHPFWNPDGTRLVFESDRFGSADIFVYELASGDVTRLTSSPAEDARPVWSPDGQWIAFHSNREGNYDLFVIRPDGTGLRRVTTGPLDETNAGWSPDSSALVYEVRLEERHWCLRIVDLASGKTRTLLERPGDHLTPFWLPDGRIAFTYSPPGGNHDTDVVLMLTDEHGKPLGELLGGAAGNSNVHAVRARKEIVFNSIRDGNWEIYTALPDGQDLRRLTEQAGAELIGIDGQPAWSPAGDRIAITSGRAGSLDIVLLSPTGEELANLTGSWRTGGDPPGDQPPTPPARRD